MDYIFEASVKQRIDALNAGERRYISGDQEYKRGNSWEYCHKAFTDALEKNLNDSDIDHLALHLAFYLASWGMYRGSSFLLNMDYKIHVEPVKMMLEERYRPLFTIGNPFASEETAQQYKDLLFDECNGIYSRLERYYMPAHITFSDSGLIMNESDTLMTKILMGVYGCIPAYDRFFKQGAFLFGRQQWLRNDGNAVCNGPRSLGALLKTGALRQELEEFHAENPQYTFMKVVDMYFFALGAFWETRCIGQTKDEKRQNTLTFKAQIRAKYR